MHIVLCDLSTEVENTWPVVSDIIGRRETSVSGVMHTD